MIFFPPHPSTPCPWWLWGQTVCIWTVKHSSGTNLTWCKGWGHWFWSWEAFWSPCVRWLSLWGGRLSLPAERTQPTPVWEGGGRREGGEGWVRGLRHHHHHHQHHLTPHTKITPVILQTTHMRTQHCCVPEMEMVQKRESRSIWALQAWVRAVMEARA